MSRRVMETLSQFAPQVEVYSIDEAFLDYTNCPYFDLKQICTTARETVLRHTGIPVSVGMAPTKALAKLANKFCKKIKEPSGVLILDNPQIIEMVLRKTAIGDVWGIGRQYSEKLRSFGIETAYDLTAAGDAFLRKQLTVVGLKLAYELRGISCFPINTAPEPKKNICTSRSFGSPISALPDLLEAVSNYAARCAMKLREQQSVCNTMQVFLQTSPFDERQPFRSFQQTVKLSVATSDTATLIQEATKVMSQLYVPGLRYKKAGVLVLELAPEANLQTTLFDSTDHALRRKLMQVMDNVNRKVGGEMVKLAIQGNEDMSPHITTNEYQEDQRANWKLRRSKLSPCYTTRREHILPIS
jgi:DNA polymerase V